MRRALKSWLAWLIPAVVTSVLLAFYVIGIVEVTDEVLLASSMALVFFSSLLALRGVEVSVRIPSNRLIRVTVLLAPWVISLALVLAIQAPLEKPQVVDWSQVPNLHIAGIGAALLLAGFYPGYFIVRMLIRKEATSILEKLVLSVLTSIFVVGLLGFVSYLVEGRIGYVASSGLIGLNVVFMLLTAIDELFPKRRGAQAYDVDLVEILSLASLMFFMYVCLYIVDLRRIFLVPTWDMWRHYGYSTMALRGTMFTYRIGPYWFYLFTAVFMALSPAPYVNSYLALTILMPIYPLSLYVLCSRLLPKRVAILATLMGTFFSGFGGLYTVITGSKLDEGYVKTYDQGMLSVVHLRPSLFTFACLFAMLYLIARPIKNGGAWAVLMAMMFSLAFLAHEAEALVFIILLPLAVLLMWARRHQNVRGLPLAIVGSLVGIALLDKLVAPIDVYGNVIIGWPLGLVTWLPTLISALLAFYPRITLATWSILARASSKLRYLRKPASIALLYVLGLSFIAWYYALPEFNAREFYYGVSMVPWYAYPTKLGVVGVLAVICLAYALLRAGRTRTKFDIGLPLAVVLVGLILARASAYLPLFTGGVFRIWGMGEDRFMRFLWIGLCPLAAAPAGELASVLYRKRLSTPKAIMAYALTAFLSLAIFVSGMPSALLFHVEAYGEAERYRIKSLPLEIVDMLDDLAKAAPADTMVLASSVSKSTVGSFGLGLFYYTGYEPAIFGARRIETFLTFISTPAARGTPLRYWYIPKAEESFMIMKYGAGLLLSHLTCYLPIFKESGFGTIYELPFKSFPSGRADVAVLIPFISHYEEDELTYMFPIETLSIAGVDYSVEMEHALNLELHSTVLLSCDYDFGALEELLSWVRKGNTLLVFDTPLPGSEGPGPFASELGISLINETVLATEVRGPDGTVWFPGVEVTKLSYGDLEVLAWYAHEGELLTPFALRKRIGSGSVVFIHIAPYLERMRMMRGRDEGRRMFSLLGDLISVLGLGLPAYKVPHGRLVGVFHGDIALKGDVEIRTSALYMPAVDATTVKAIGWLEDAFLGTYKTSTYPGEGNVTLSSDGEILTVIFDAYTFRTWQNLFIDVPDVDAARYRFLIIKEKIVCHDYRLGFLRLRIGDYVYVVRKWTEETSPPGHPWKTYVFDLYEAIPQEAEAPMPPEGNITQITWSGYAIGDAGGHAELYLDYIIFSEMPVATASYGRIWTNLHTKNVGQAYINGTAQDTISDFGGYLLSLDVRGAVEVSMRGDEARITPPGIGPYMRLSFPENVSISIDMQESSMINMTLLTADGHQLDIALAGGEFSMDLYLEGEDIIIYAPELTISAEGRMQVEKAWVERAMGLYCPSERLEVVGRASFSALAMDISYTLVAWLTISGKVAIGEPGKVLVKVSEWDLPWADIFLSGMHIALVSILITSVVFASYREVIYRFLRERLLRALGGLLA